MGPWARGRIMRQVSREVQVAETTWGPIYRIQSCTPENVVDLKFGSRLRSASRDEGTSYMVERRSASRIRVTLSVQYDSESVTMNSWVSDLSCTGLFLRSEFLDHPGSEVTMRLELPDRNGVLDLRGEVARVDERPASSGMGIRFTSVPEPSRVRLANFMIEHTYQGAPRV